MLFRIYFQFYKSMSAYYFTFLRSKTINFQMCALEFRVVKPEGNLRSYFSHPWPLNTWLFQSVLINLPVTVSSLGSFPSSFPKIFLSDHLSIYIVLYRHRMTLSDLPEFTNSYLHSFLLEALASCFSHSCSPWASPPSPNPLPISWSWARATCHDGLSLVSDRQPSSKGLVCRNLNQNLILWILS